MLTAAPIIRKSLDAIGAPGATDFVSIFLAAELNGEEYRTTLRHEQAHVWARHNMRRPPSANSANWIAATELEIARNIYDARDLDTIVAPRSRLHGAYLPDTIAALPRELLLAEDIYDWLCSHESDLPRPRNCVTCGEGYNNEQAARNHMPPPSAGEIRKELDRQEAAAKSDACTVGQYRNMLRRPPSLVDLIDALLRVRVAPESSWRRPSRREIPGVIVRGKIPTPRPPRVEIFVDRSGSFTAEKTQTAFTALSCLLRRYGASIRQDVWFFGDNKLTAVDDHVGGNTPYALIASHLARTRPRVAIIITDDDECPPLPSPLPRAISVICIPIGCMATKVSAQLGGKDAAVLA